jgi:hypothetical protein
MWSALLMSLSKPHKRLKKVVYIALRKPTIEFRAKYWIVAGLAVWYTHKQCLVINVFKQNQCREMI